MEGCLQARAGDGLGFVFREREGGREGARESGCACVCVFICVCVHIYIYMYVHMCMFRYVRRYVYTCIWIQAYGSGDAGLWIQFHSWNLLQSFTLFNVGT